MLTDNGAGLVLKELNAAAMDLTKLFATATGFTKCFTYVTLYRSLQASGFSCTNTIRAAASKLHTV